VRASPLLSLALALLAAAGLAACGGGGSSNSTSAQGGSTPTATRASAPGSGSENAGKQPAAGKASGSKGSSGSASGGTSSEGSASFRAPTADNSIPNFGAEAPTSQRSRAAAVLAGFLAARARGDWPMACTYLSSSTRAGVQRFSGAAKRKASCGALLAALSGSSPAATRADTFVHGLASLRIKGTSGFALFYGPHNQKYVIPMVNEGGAWKVGQLAPIAYPLGSETTAR
jgi:hypothetical protein